MKSKKEDLKIWKREHHVNRNDLSGEHPFGDLGQIIFLIIFLIIWIFDSFVFYFSTIFSKYIPIYVKLSIAGIVFLLAGYLARSGLNIVFKEVRDPPQVINKGVFGLVRHPIYLGALLLYVGFILTTLSIISFVLLIFIFLFYNYISSYEEKNLEKKFGKEYSEYLKRVPKWIPRLFIPIQKWFVTKTIRGF